MKKLEEFVKDKRVLFITTKNLDYIRNTQELRIIREYAKDVDILYSEKKTNGPRIIEVLKKLNKQRVEQADVVFVGFEPQFVVPFKRKLLGRKPLAIDFFISVYDTMVNDRRKIKDRSFLSNICHRFDDITMNAADLVIADTKAHADYFISEHNGAGKEFEVIYLEADPEIYYPRERAQKKSDDKYKVLYFGSILPLQGVEIVLGAIKELKDNNDIVFDIIGPIPETYDKPIQDNVVYTDWLSQEKLAERIADADLCLAGHFHGEILKASRTIPGKAYIYEMMGKKMILGDGLANHELFETDEKHFFVKMGDPKALAEKIVEVYQMEEH